MGKMTKPTKSDLYNLVDHLERENEKLNNTINQEQIKKWEDARPVAYEAFWKYANAAFPNLVIKEKLEHIDAAGYWFTFELKNDDRRQTYAVRHTDLL